MKNKFWEFVKRNMKIQEVTKQINFPAPHLSINGFLPQVEATTTANSNFFENNKSAKIINIDDSS